MREARNCTNRKNIRGKTNAHYGCVYVSSMPKTNQSPYQFNRISKELIMKHNPAIRHPFNQGDFLSRHHCYPICRVNSGTLPKGINTHLVIKLWRTKHDFWHCLFEDATIDEVIHRLCFDKSVQYNYYYNGIFNCHPFEAVKILERIKRIKNR